MAKNTENNEQQQTNPTLEALLRDGTARLTANTREALFAQVEQLKAGLEEGKTLTVGAVGKDRESDLLSIQVDIVTL